MQKFVNLGTRNESEEEDDTDVDDRGISDFNFTGILNKSAVEKRNIYLWGDVGEDTAISVISQLHYYADVSNKPIQIIIHSNGGEIDAEEAIIDEMIAIQKSGITINTIVTGKAYSAAALILIMGTIGHRYARPNASIMLHPVSYGLGADYAEYQEKMSAFIRLKNKSMNDMIGKQMGLKTDKQVKKLVSDMDKGLWMTPGEALERKIIDHILDGPMPGSKGNKNVNVKRNNAKRVRSSVSK